MDLADLVRLFAGTSSSGSQSCPQQAPACPLRAREQDLVCGSVSLSFCLLILVLVLSAFGLGYHFGQGSVVKRLVVRPERQLRALDYRTE